MRPPLGNRNKMEIPFHSRIHEIEVVHPGFAYEWKSGATGLYVRTNLTADKINNRETPCLFKTDASVWGWAKRVATPVTTGGLQ